MTAQTWPALVAAVEHAPNCDRLLHIDQGHGHHHSANLPCNCDRDARIARGIEAALAERARHGCYSDEEDGGFACYCAAWRDASPKWEANYAAHVGAAAARAFEDCPGFAPNPEYKEGR